MALSWCVEFLVLNWLLMTKNIESSGLSQATGYFNHLNSRINSIEEVVTEKLNSFENRIHLLEESIMSEVGLLEKRLQMIVNNQEKLGNQNVLGHVEKESSHNSQNKAHNVKCTPSFESGKQTNKTTDKTAKLLLRGKRSAAIRGLSDFIQNTNTELGQIRTSLNNVYDKVHNLENRTAKCINLCQSANNKYNSAKTSGPAYSMPKVTKIIETILAKVNTLKKDNGNGNGDVQSSPATSSQLSSMEQIRTVSSPVSPLRQKQPTTIQLSPLPQTQTATRNFNPLEQTQSISSMPSPLIQTQTKLTQQYTKPPVIQVSGASCKELFNSGQTQSGVYLLNVALKDFSSFDGYCDMATDGGGWLVFQRRQNGLTDFSRTWQNYKQGFGNITDEFWLGNDLLHQLTSSKPHELRVDLWDWEGGTRYAKYGLFQIGSEANGYKIKISTYSGTAGDDLNYSNGYKFATKDRDSLYKCSEKTKGSWWYYYCSDSNLNAPYRIGGHFANTGTTIWGSQSGLLWYRWKGLNYSLKKTEMKIRPK